MLQVYIKNHKKIIIKQFCLHSMDSFIFYIIFLWFGGAFFSMRLLSQDGGTVCQFRSNRVRVQNCKFLNTVRFFFFFFVSLVSLNSICLHFRLFSFRECSPKFIRLLFAMSTSTWKSLTFFFGFCTKMDLKISYQITATVYWPTTNTLELPFMLFIISC